MVPAMTSPDARTDRRYDQIVWLGLGPMTLLSPAGLQTSLTG